MTLAPIPPPVLAAWRDLDGRPARILHGGLINDTFLVEGRRGDVVLQRLHPVFAGEVNEDIEAVTAHLAAKGLATPRLLRTDGGALWVEHLGRPWRAQTFVAGETVERVESPARAREAAALVARFHGALADLDWRYRHVRAGVHDTARHLEALRRVFAGGEGGPGAPEGDPRAHRLYDRAAPLAEELLAAAEALPDFSSLPARHAHGDLKISNVLFEVGPGAAAGRAICLVDLDTLGRMPWPHEMGDALRSWCNPRGEDVAEAALDEEIFRAAVTGYAAAARDVVPVATGEAAALAGAEVALLVAGVHAICVELAARFLADAIAERYFGWDPSRFPGRGEHNLLRARGQASLAASVRAQAGALEEIVRLAWGVG